MVGRLIRDAIPTRSTRLIPTLTGSGLEGRLTRFCGIGCDRERALSVTGGPLCPG
jgi:hypothetical protein